MLSCACFRFLPKKRMPFKSDDRARIASLFLFGLIMPNIAKLSRTADQASLAPVPLFQRLRIVRELFNFPSC